MGLLTESKQNKLSTFYRMFSCVFKSYYQYCYLLNRFIILIIKLFLIEWYSPVLVYCKKVGKFFFYWFFFQICILSIRTLLCVIFTYCFHLLLLILLKLFHRSWFIIAQTSFKFYFIVTTLLAIRCCVYGCC